MSLKLPVFVSAPSSLNAAQQQVYDFIAQALDEEGLQPRTLGRSDYPKADPATEAYYIARACHGGLILGFAQIEFEAGIAKRGSPQEKPLARTALPTPWNQLEAGMLIALRRPLLVFVEPPVEGGVFDQGAFAGYLQRISAADFSADSRHRAREGVRIWSGEVRAAFRA